MINKPRLQNLLVKIALNGSLDIDELAMSVEPIWKLLGYKSGEDHISMIKKRQNYS